PHGAHSKPMCSPIRPGLEGRANGLISRPQLKHSLSGFGGFIGPTALPLYRRERESVSQPPTPKTESWPVIVPCRLPEMESPALKSLPADGTFGRRPALIGSVGGIIVTMRPGRDEPVEPRMVGALRAGDMRARVRDFDW